MIETKAVFFDWDGTLVDTIPTLFKSHNMVRIDYGFEPYTREQFFENIQFSSRELYPRIYGPESDNALKKLYDYVEKIHLQELTTLSGAADLLDMLHTQEYGLAVISNKRHEYLLREINHLGWNGYFRAAGGAGYADDDKPSAAPVQKALMETNLTPSDIVYVGDTETDMKTAKAVGCRSVLVLNDENKDHLLSKYNPDYVVNNCAELSSLLNRTEKQKINTK